MTTTADPRAAARDVLTEEEAASRSTRISNVTYDIAIGLTAGSSTYRGDCTVTFDISGREPTFIDFRGGIETLEIDGRLVDRPSEPSNRICLEVPALDTRMTVRVVYQNESDTTGDGFHRFVDPEDGLEYVYSNFQPFAAHRLFPCFDQPDLKATYRLTVDAPAEWAVVTADPAQSIEPLGAELRRHRFAPTRPFSTYLMSLIAGPFHAVHRSRPDGVTLGLYCRRSLARFLGSDEADEIFTITEQGLDFFTELFGQPYPFIKYDQLFVPEFNVGAMENVGAVTFTETFVFRDRPTETQRQQRAEVVLHELVHMWFGDLVTMRWWNDLWLNESFATYISYVAQTEATRFTGAWKSFATSVKRWGYRQDQLPTTHPIRGDAPDTETAFLNFDGITYGKGASVLKQLVATIGRDGFTEGMRTYFRRHAWSNATLADFLAALEAGSGQDLREWARLWLETPSLNTIAARWEADAERVTGLRLEQSAPAEHPYLRPHTLMVGLVSGNGSSLALDSLSARIEGRSIDLPEAVGKPAPLMVFPNHDDHAYAKVALDPISLDFVRERLHQVSDPLLRELLWLSLWEMVRDGQLSSLHFLAVVRDQVVHEADIDLLEEVLTRTQAALRWYIPEKSRDEEGRAITRLAMARLPTAPATDARITWLRAAIAAAPTGPDLVPMLDLADGTTTLPGVVVDQRMRWDLAAKAMAYDVPDADQRLRSEEARDPSDRGQRAAIRAAVARPAASVKAEAWERIHGQGYGSFHLTRAAMEGFHWPSQRDVTGPFEIDFFERVRDVFTTRDYPFATAYLALLFPDLVPEAATLERGRALLAELGPSDVLLERGLREKLDDVARAIRVRAVAEAGAD